MRRQDVYSSGPRTLTRSGVATRPAGHWHLVRPRSFRGGARLLTEVTTTKHDETGHGCLFVGDSRIMSAPNRGGGLSRWGNRSSRCLGTHDQLESLSSDPSLQSKAFVSRSADE